MAEIILDWYKKDFNFAYLEPLVRTDRLLVLYGGAGAGKSYFAAQKIIDFITEFENKKLLIMRKTYPALKLTSLELIENLLKKYKIPYQINRSDLILYTIRGNRLIFKSLDDPEKIKSITDVDFIWFEEPTEIKEEEFDMVNLRLRGQRLPEGHYRQFILTFNPIDKNHWLYKRFFQKGVKKTFIGKYTYKNNRFIDEDYKRELEDLKDKDENLYRVYALGEWGTLKNKVYSNYTVENFEYKMDWYDEIIAGVDFGYNNPSVYLLVGIKDKEIYLIDEIYKSHLLNSQFIDLILEKNKEWGINPEIYCETAEPDRIEEMYKAGLRVKEAKKDVIQGINFVKMQKIHIHARCVNTIKEIQGYSYKEDRNGNVLEEPVKFNDHAMDAMRYAIYTHLGKREKMGVFADINKEEIEKWESLINSLEGKK